MKSVKELIDLSGRAALITGGTGGIGYAAAEGLAELGANIVLVDVDAEHTEKKAQLIAENYGVKALGLGVDVADEAALLSLPELLAKEMGGLDILIHSAAYVGSSNLEGWVCPFPEQKSDVWRKALEVNVTSFFVLTQAFQELLEASGHGSVIALSSIYGVVGPDMRLYDGTSMGNPAAYAASKGALQQYVRYLSTIMAPSVRVNAVAPGGVWRNQPEAFHKRYIEKTPMQRMGTEEDMKGAIVFLASDLSQYVTGQNLIVDGGWTAW